jgi:hypothetical protein
MPAPVSMSASHASADTAAPPDAMVIHGYRVNFSIKTNADGTTLTNLVGGTVTSLPPTARLLKFADAYTVLDLNGAAAQVYRLYQAAFNRKPDAGGLGYWINMALAGVSINDIASSFIASDEFRRLYGSTVSADQFVAQLYSNILHRAGEPAGINWWASTISNGATRESVLIGFSDSDENKAGVNASLSGSFDYTPYQPGGPIVPQKTSYLNAKNINIGPQHMPVGIGFKSNEAITAGHQYGDFFQDGTIAMVAASNVFAGSNGFGSTVAGRFYFFHSDGKGGWLDQTDKLLSDRTGCISPRKVIVADFNGDGRPDVFVACHGIDGNIPTGYPQGEHPRYLLSQADGSYKNVELPIVCYCHGATAADFDGNGYADVVMASPPVLGRLVYLKNNRDGTFADRPDLLPASTTAKSIWSLDFVDVNGDGKFDLATFGSENILGNNADPALIKTTTPGQSSWDWPMTIFINDGTNQFSDRLQKATLPFTALGDPWDIIAKGGKIALLRAPNNQTGKIQVQVLAYPSMNQLSLTQEPALDTVWFTLYNGAIVGAFSSNPFTVPF